MAPCVCGTFPHRVIILFDRTRYTELRFLLTALRFRFLSLLLLSLLLALVVAASIPRSYTIDVGLEEGYGGDLPLLWNFNTAEDDEHGTYRWTQDGASVVLPGMGQRPLVVQLDFNPINPLVAQNGPDRMDVVTGGGVLATLPVYERGRRYNLSIPASAMMMTDGQLALTFRTATFSPPGDPRSLGSPLDGVKVSTLAPLSLAAPDWGAVWRWVGTILVVWLVLLRSLGTDPSSVRVSRWLAGGCGVLVVLAALLDPPRWGYGASPALIATCLSYGLLLLLRPALPLLAAHLHLPLNRRTQGWLLLITVVAFGLRSGGRLYPLSMWGDIGFHTNRFIDTFGLGKVYLVSRNRGVNFPYPPGGYLTLAPFILLHLDIRIVLQLVAALVDGLSAPLIYAIGVRATHQPRTRSSQSAQTTTLVAAAVYVFTAAGYMLTWWSFDTHIYTQFATLVLLTALVIMVDTERVTTPPQTLMLVIGLLLCGVFLGHFGFFMNMVLMGGLLLVVVWLLSWRGNQTARDARWPLTVAFIGAGVFAFLFFYSAYVWLFLNQFFAVSEGGLTGLAERAPVGRDRLWGILWEAGLVQHFGFFPLLLLPVGMWALWKRGKRASVLLTLMTCSVAVSALFAVLPFITLSTQSTRWLTFSAWAVAVGSALAARLLWHCGRAGRGVVLAMAGFVIWNTATFWVGPMLWHIRPPEPF